jgi:serine/threonine protein phosphatase PrpC
LLEVRNLYIFIKYSIADLAFKNDDRYKISPKDMLIEAVNDNREIGSCTCVLATLDEQAPLMYTANIGDSGYMLLRKEGLDLIKLFRSKE